MPRDPWDLVKPIPDAIIGDEPIIPQPQQPQPIFELRSDGGIGQAEAPERTPARYLSVEDLHLAAKIIETDGIDGIRTAVSRVGWNVAMALLIAHFRRAKGSMETFPPRPEIEEQVNELLKEAGLIPPQR